MRAQPKFHCFECPFKCTVIDHLHNATDLNILLCASFKISFLGLVSVSVIE